MFVHVCVCVSVYLYVFLSVCALSAWPVASCERGGCNMRCICPIVIVTYHVAPKLTTL